MMRLVPSRPLCSLLRRQPVEAHLTGKRQFSVTARNAKAGQDSCKKLEEKAKDDIVCKKPNLHRKPVPPYRYGYCREPDRPMLMSCPPKIKKSGKGPCCHDDVPQKKGGCRSK